MNITSIILMIITCVSYIIYAISSFMVKKESKICNYKREEKKIKIFESFCNKQKEYYDNIYKLLK